MPSDRSSSQVLMCVFNPIEYDGRVQRSAHCLAEHFDVHLMAVDAGGDYADPVYRVQKLQLPSGGSKYLSHLRFWLHLFRAALRRRPAVLYAHDYFMAFPGWVAARLSGARFVYDAHEIMFPSPGERLARREQIWYSLERTVVRHADLVIAANAERADLMREHFGLRETPGVVRNIAAPSPRRYGDVELLERYPLLRRRGNDELLVVYQGDMSYLRGIGVFLDAIQRLPRHVRLVLVGGGPDARAIAARAEDAGLTGRVSFLGLVPRNDLFDILQACDIGLVSYPMEGFNNVYCAPNKIYEYAQAGLPLVTTAQPPLRSALDRYGIGVVVEPTPANPGGDGEAWACAISRVVAAIDEHRARIDAFLADHHWSDDHEALAHTLVRRFPELAPGRAAMPAASLTTPIER